VRPVSSSWLAFVAEETVFGGEQAKNASVYTDIRECATVSTFGESIIQSLDTVVVSEEYEVVDIKLFSPQGGFAKKLCRSSTSST
jgi:hypothetical protein